MYVVTTTSVSNSVLSVVAECEGEMLDRVRYAMQSPYILEVKVSCI